ncbi:acetyltransferase (GNAT) family protein [Streptomyces sp. BK022]|uniref:GNAT family N-acetyltransferase n=1 Tax=Streptomyces sp. BK022 TaxID=2512123 RepID=UPI0010289D5B|nr:GNAT family N-acetyltransferase [Streptomyces sp. BK022]RZU46261.1 acetyltransferase (GNAT) family protein [Streptomyces sp. BK022]
MSLDVQNFAAANLLRRPEPIRVGGFVAGFDPATTSPYVNYATPLPGTAPTEAEVAALVDEFVGRGLVPGLEFAPEAAPEVEPALRRAGFATEAVHEYLVCTPATLTRPAGLPATRSPRTDAEFAEIDAALAEAFGAAFPAPADGASLLRRTRERGGAVRFVRAEDGACAGAAGCSAPAEGTAELAGVGTRPAYRGRGVAAAVTSTLAGALFERGAGSVWLEPAGDGSRRVYERVGFRPGGTRLYLRLGAPLP